MTPDSQIIERVIERVKELPPLSRIAVLSVSGLLVIGILAWSVSSLLQSNDPVQATPSHTSTPASTSTPTSTANYSPLIFGTNLQLSDTHDQVLTSQPTRNLLQQLHVQIIRESMHPSLSKQTEVQAATDVKNLGALLDVVLEGPSDATALQDDTRMIHDMNTLFGNQTVYYEFGDEQDLMGISASQYVSSWNQIIPQLKALAPHSQFIGPVTYHYDQSYLHNFLMQAKPGPDAVSWHEYTCTASDPQNTCLAHIDDWSTHIKSAQSTVKTALGIALPIIISEWNYAPDAHATDGKNTDQAFMGQWTQKALQTLLSNHIFASMQYSCTNTAAPLINNKNTITTQGSIFQQQYTQVIKTPPVSTPTATAPTHPTPHPTPSPTVPPAEDPTPTAAQNPVVPPTLPAPTQAPQPTPTPKAKPTPTPKPPSCPAQIQSGSKGSLVTMLQKSLNSHYAAHDFPNSPYNFSPPLAVDGDFGPLTQSAVKDYQKAHGLEVDGQVGPKTWHSLGYC